MDLSKLEADTDALNKKGYQVVKATWEPGSAAFEALSTIPTEQARPRPT